MEHSARELGEMSVKYNCIPNGLVDLYQLSHAGHEHPGVLETLAPTLGLFQMQLWYLCDQSCMDYWIKKATHHILPLYEGTKILSAETVRSECSAPQMAIPALRQTLARAGFGI